MILVAYKIRPFLHLLCYVLLTLACLRYLKNASSSGNRRSKAWPRPSFPRAVRPTRWMYSYKRESIWHDGLGKCFVFRPDSGRNVLVCGLMRLYETLIRKKEDCAMKSAELKVQEWNCNVAATYSNSKHMVWQMILNGNVLYLRRSQRLHRRKIVGVLPPKAVFYFWPFSSTSQCCLSQLTHQIFQTNIGRARRQ